MFHWARLSLWGLGAPAVRGGKEGEESWLASDSFSASKLQDWEPGQPRKLKHKGPGVKAERREGVGRRADPG